MHHGRLGQCSLDRAQRLLPVSPARLSKSGPCAVGAKRLPDLRESPAARRRRKGRSRAHIDERNTDDELEMTGLALCSNSFIVEDTQLVTGSSSSIHQAVLRGPI